jgi:hypothetical protein
VYILEELARFVSLDAEHRLALAIHSDTARQVMSCGMEDESDPRNQTRNRSQFDCHICLCPAVDPVVTLCAFPLVLGISESELTKQNWMY